MFARTRYASSRHRLAALLALASAARYRPHEIVLTRTIKPLRSDSDALHGRPLSAPDGSGAVIPSGDGTTAEQTLVRAPVDAHPAVEFLRGEWCFYQIWWIIHFPLSNAKNKDFRACDQRDEHMCAFQSSTTFRLFVSLLTK
jgi:hypothetical protein